MDRHLRVIVVGVGGIGTWLSEGLARMLDFKFPQSGLVLVDGDHFEPKNKERQSFRDLGNKAEIKANELTPYFLNTFIAPIGKWVVETFDDPKVSETDTAITAAGLLRDGDVVFAVVDNFAARSLLFNAARELDNVDVFTGGNDDRLFASVYHYRRRDGHDITDHPAEYHPQYLDPPDRNPAELSCQERAELEGGVQLIATNMTVAAMLLGRFHHTIVENSSPVAEAEIFVDLAVAQMGKYDRTPDGTSVFDVQEELVS